MTRSTAPLLAVLLAVVFVAACDDDDTPGGNTRVTTSGSVVGPSAISPAIPPTAMPTFPHPAPNHPIFGSAAALSGTCPTISFVIGTQVVQTDRATVFRGFACPSFRNNFRVGVEGRLLRSGALLATVVERKN